MVLQTYIEQLSQELQLPEIPVSNDQHVYSFIVVGFQIEMWEGEKEIYFFAAVARLPNHNREEFLTYVMKANFLGQGTGGSVLGIKEDESSLTLSKSLPYETPYRDFKDLIENFVNYLEFWTKEIHQYENKTIKN